MTRTATNNITGPKYGAPRDMPWDVMGEHLKPADTKSLSRALKAAGMDYDVEVWDSQAVDPLTGRTLTNDKGRQIVRPTADGMTVIGQTGTRFTPTQNRDAFGIANELTAEHGARIVGLADYRHGSASMLALDLGDPIELKTRQGGTDTLEQFLIASNHHDGNGALTFAFSTFRPACTNALPTVVRDAKSVWKIAHTPNADERQKLVHAMIREAVGYRQAVTVAAQAMLSQKMADAEFAKIVAGMFPVDPETQGKVADRRRETQGMLVDIYKNSPTLEGIRGTRWGGLQCLTEYQDWFRPTNGKDDAAKDRARAEGQIDGPNVRVKRAMWERFAVA